MVRYIGVILVIAMASVAPPVRDAQLPPDPNEDIRELLEELAGDSSIVDSVSLDDWPTDSNDELGFKFDKADYPVLNSFTVQSDDTTVGRYTGKHRAIWWNWERPEYEALISRQIVLVDNDHSISVHICVTPRHAAAKRIMVREFADKWELRSLVPTPPAWGPDFNVAAGHILLLHDEDRGGSWDGNDSRDLSCVQHNILIDLKKSEGCAVNLPDLADDMVSEITAQEAARVAASDPLRPTATAILSQNQIDFPAMDAVGNYVRKETVDFTVTKSGWNGTVTKYGFLASKGHPVTGTTQDGKAEYDDTKIIYRPLDATEDFDDVNDPTSITFNRNTGSKASSDWHVAVVVWGDNLVPAFAYDTMNIVRGK